MKKIIISCAVLLCGFIYAKACDYHNYRSNMHTWHTKAIQPVINKLGNGKLAPDKVFASITQTVSEQGAHLNEVYGALGMDTVKHIDILALYAARMGKPFRQDETVLKYLAELNRIRAGKKFTAESAEDFHKLRIQAAESIKDTLVGKELEAMILLFEESGTYWDIALNEYPLAPKSKNAVRRDDFDATNFSNYYRVLRDLGLNHDFAHTIAVIETAYDAIFCKKCGVW
ncbi:MAG: hypothetical protein IPM95_04860 [Sphingobacteriales bacterium]|nr:hypothetical protein [Sphingobacteriales bacterium]